jgi:hypothetical protein
VLLREASKEGLEYSRLQIRLTNTTVFVVSRKGLSSLCNSHVFRIKRRDLVIFKKKRLQKKKKEAKEWMDKTNKLLEPYCRQE